MREQINIEPITRIEGHAKITIRLGEEGEVDDARFHVTQFRGFEEFCHGRPLHEMPSITSRICGICPVSHMIASGKACDGLLAVRIPDTASKLREILQIAQIEQSHALSFFHLSSPDLLLGMDADVEQRNIFGLIEENPEMAKQGIKLRKFGQQVIEKLAGKRIHAAWVDAGGVNNPLDAERRDQILRELPDALDSAKSILKTFKGMLGDYEEEIETFGNFPSAFMGSVDEQGEQQLYDGKLRLVDQNGNMLEDKRDPADYQEFVAEEIEPWTYLKFPYYEPQGYPDGIYRVGPLARLNVVDACGTPEADKELKEFRQLASGPIQSSFHFHYARLIEIVYCLERMRELLESDDILNTNVKAEAQPNATEAVGIAEAPRGTLIHHYKTDDDGLIEWVNLVIATGHNNLAMNKSVTQVARRYVDSENLEEGMLNRVEAVIRAYDPCLSCSTHALGQMPMQIQLVDPEGAVLDEVRRG